MVGVLWFSLAGCGSITASTPLDALPSTEGRDQQWAAIFQEHTRAEEAVATLILAERQATIDQDLDLLGQLWAENARIVDGRGSSATTDDYVWQGRSAILDRYQVAVFPFDLPPLTQLAAETAITITGDEATVQHGGDQWQLVRTNERWWLMTLHYQMAPVVN